LTDSIVCDTPIFNRLTPKPQPNNHTSDDIGLQKKIKKRDKKLLQDPKIRKLCSDDQIELNYLWNSDPSRQGKEVYDSGEVKELNKLWQRNAVIRESKRGLIRVSTGRPVYWSEPLGKWVDLAQDDRSNWK